MRNCGWAASMIPAWVPHPAAEEVGQALTTTLTAVAGPPEGRSGLRLDYRGYMDFHQDFSEYNVIDQSLSLEPQYKAGPFIYSLPFSFNLTMEDGGHDYNRYAVSPTLTYLIPDTRQAVAVLRIRRAD